MKKGRTAYIPGKARRWTVTIAALGINMLIGILYSWSIIQRAMVVNWGWSNTEASLPYTLCIATFAITMIFAGRAQDRYGPRPVALLGSIMFGGGLIGSAFAPTPALMMATFGIACGIGIGLCFSAATPAAIKWFDPNKKGIVTGVVVAGVGLSPIYTAPLTEALLRACTIEHTFLVLGIIALGGLLLLSLVLTNPPAGHENASTDVTADPRVKNSDIPWREMIRTRTFIILWSSYLLSAAAGLMLVGHLAGIAIVQAQWEAGFVLVVILAIFNTLGRIAGGYISDRSGPVSALMLMFMVQAVNIFLFTFYRSVPALMAGSAIAGFAYGSLLALFPAATAGYFGLKNLGVNYGIIFTGWGAAGIVGPIIGGAAADITGSYVMSYIISAVMLLGGAVLVNQLRADPRL